MFMLLSIYTYRELQQQKKKLPSAYKEAKQNKKRTESRIEKAKYCLYIDNVKHNPTFTDSERENSESDSDYLIIAVQF